MLLEIWDGGARTAPAPLLVTTIRFAVVKGALVTIDNCRDAIDSRVEDVAVEGEAVRSSVAVRRHSATETIQVDHLVLVVELEDVAD